MTYSNDFLESDEMLFSRFALEHHVLEHYVLEDVGRDVSSMSG